ncbi:MAG: inositol monophosphatase family protein [Promethearchaeota archaeon]
MNWEQHLLEATLLAKQRVLSCLQEEPGYKEVVGVGAGGDETKRFDQVAEQTIAEYLQDYVDFTLISEEAGVQQHGSNPEGYVILDPIDGSTNVSRGLPIACISAAYGPEPRFDMINVAVVREVFSERCFHAIRGKGAFSNHVAIRPAEPRPLERSFIGVDDEFPPKLVSNSSLASKGRRLGSTRHLGSNALELCYVANGAFDAFVDLRGTFRGTDLSAASLILNEAGAVLVNPQGQPVTGRCTNEDRYSYVAARDLKLAQELLRLVG